MRDSSSFISSSISNLKTMAKRGKKTAHQYELEIKKMIESRTGTFDDWLQPQLEATAMNRVMLAKIQQELEDETTLMITMPGSMGQTKLDAHPLLSHYDKLQRTLIQQYEALGLNFRTTPSKVVEPTKKGVDENDPMVTFYSNAKK